MTRAREKLICLIKENLMGSVITVVKEGTRKTNAEHQEEEHIQETMTTIIVMTRKSNHAHIVGAQSILIILVGKSFLG